MIPLRDNIPARRKPVVTTVIIVVTTYIFFHQIGLGPQAQLLFIQKGVVPARFFGNGLGINGGWVAATPTLFSYMFLHGGWMHLIGNMWMLWIFGDNIEDRLGHLRFVIFYILCGVGSGLFHVFTNTNSIVPTVGASGAIAGVMGAYFVLYPRARVLTLVIIVVFIQLIEIPAFIFLGLWFLMQFLMGSTSLLAGSSAAAGGVAWWAHIGGFVIGIYLLRWLIEKPKLRSL